MRKTFKTNEKNKEFKSLLTDKENKMSKAFDLMKKAIESKKDELLRAEISRIQLEKARRYEYHKKYNQKKKDLEDEILKKAKELGLTK